MSSLDELRKDWLLSRSGSLKDVVLAANQAPRANPFAAVGEKRNRDEWNLTALRLPMSAAPSGAGRGRTFVARKVTGRLLALADAMLLAVNTDAKSMSSLMAMFDEFETLNIGIPRDGCFLLFLLDAVSQGIKASSAVTYGRTLLAGFHRSGTPLISPLVDDLFRIMELIRAGEDTDHAIDITVDQAWSIVDAVPLGPVRLAIYFVLAFGCRVADLVCVLTEDLAFNPDRSVTLYFRRTKNHRSAKQRYSIRITPRRFIDELTGIIGRRGAIFGGVVAAVSVAQVNQALAAAAGSVFGPEGLEGVTSYSLRRCFIHTCISKATVGDVTDWMTVAKSTGHYDLEVLRNSYAKKFDNVL